MPKPKPKTNRKRAAAKPRPAPDKEIKEAKHTAVSAVLIAGVAVIVAALIVYGVTFQPRPTSAPAPIKAQTQPSFAAAIPPAAPPPQQPQPSFEAAIPPASPPAAPPQPAPSPVQATAAPASQAAAKPTVPDSVQYDCRYGSADRIIAACSAWIGLDPNSAEAYEHRAFADDLENLTDQAIADDTKAIALDPHRATVYYSRGQAYEKKGLRDRAIADYRAAVKLDPNYGNPQDALQRLGVTP